MCSMSGAWFFISAIRGLMKTSDQMGSFSLMHRLHQLLQVMGVRAADGDQVHRLIRLNADGDLADEAGDAFRLADHVEILALEHL